MAMNCRPLRPTLRLLRMTGRAGRFGAKLRLSLLSDPIMSSLHLTAFSRRDKQLADLTAAAHAILALDRAFKRLLPGQLGQFCQVACVRDGELVVYAHNSTVAARLKLLGNSLLAPLQRQGHPLRSLRVKVLPTPPKLRKPKSFALSEAGVSAFDDAARQIRNPVVREAMLALLAHHKSR